MAGRSSLTRRCNASLPLAAAVALLVLAAAQSAPARDQYDPVLRELLIDAIGAAESFDDRFTAEIWLTDMSDRLAGQVPDADERLEILRTVHFRALEAGVAPELVLAVIDVESNFDRFAISRASALGLMQVMPFWVDEVGYADKNLLFDIDFNILLGCRILRYYLDMENGDLIQGLARYNGSTGRRWYGDRVIERLRSKWFRL
ncbi:MAG: lytic transglycosylase domain-containing protein [Gammaproteobacteria bacterium]|jgi:soluble lytic murein transglycosylase-like protein